MSHRYRKLVPLVVLAALAVPFMVGCPAAQLWTLTVTNFTDTRVSEVFLAPNEAAAWGGNQVPLGINVNQSADVTGIPSGIYKMRATFNTAGAKWAIDEYGVPFAQNNVKWTLGGQIAQGRGYSNVNLQLVP